jgi:hypothetical protein
MPNSRKRKPKKAPEKPGRRQEPKVKSYSTLRTIIVWFLGIMTAIGGAAAVVTFLPRVSIEPPGPFEPTRPLTAPFHISNNNFVPLDNGEVAIWICNVFVQPPQPRIHKCEFDPAAKMSSFWVRMARWKFARISMDDKFDAPLGDVFNIQPPTEIFGIDIIMTVAYHPWILPWTRTFMLRFYTRQQSDGQLYWLAIPPQENPYY